MATATNRVCPVKDDSEFIFEYFQQHCRRDGGNFLRQGRGPLPRLSNAAGARDSLSPISYISVAASGLEFCLSGIGDAVLCSAIAGGFKLEVSMLIFYVWVPSPLLSPSTCVMIDEKSYLLRGKSSSRSSICFKRCRPLDTISSRLPILETML